MTYPCPRCGHHVLSGPPGTGGPCPVCATREVPEPAPHADDSPAWAPVTAATPVVAEPHLNGDARIGSPATPEADPAPDQFPPPHMPGWGPRRPDRLISSRASGARRLPLGRGGTRDPGRRPSAVPVPVPVPVSRDGISSRVRAVVNPQVLRRQGARVRVVVAATDDLLTDDHLWLARRWAPRVALVALVLTLLATGWLHAVLAVVTGAAVLVLVTALVWTWWRLGPRRWWLLGGEERREQLARIHADAVDASRAPGIELVRVRRVHHTAGHGSRCLVETAEGRSRDAWFWHARPRRGAVLLVRAQPSNPAQTSDLHLLQVGNERTGSGIVQRLPRSSWRAGRDAGRGAREARPARDGGPVHDSPHPRADEEGAPTV